MWGELESDKYVGELNNKSALKETSPSLSYHNVPTLEGLCWAQRELFYRLHRMSWEENLTHRILYCVSVDVTQLYIFECIID